MVQRRSIGAFLIHAIALCIIAGAGVSVASAQTYEDCGSNCSNLAISRPVSYSGLWSATNNPASKVNDGNTGTTSTCEGASGLCTIASDSGGGQAAGNYLQIDLGQLMSVKSGKVLTYSGLWNATNNPASKVNDTNTGTTSTCEGASGYCAIASDSGGGQAVGNYLQIDLGQLMSVKSVTVYGRRDTALTQGQNLNLNLSVDGSNWNTTFMSDTTSSSGHTVSTARLARYVRVETTTTVYLSLYEIVVTGMPPAPSYVDCGGSCTNLATGKTVTYSALWDATNNPASKVNDSNTGTTSTCEGASGYCAIASDIYGGQAVGNYLQIDLASP